MARSNGAAARMRMALNREEGLERLDEIILQHGVVGGEPFSFKDHEYQMQIMRDTSARIDVRKCSQVGLSELMVQKTVALLAIMKNVRIMFSLPTKEMAMGFSKDRFDSCIQQSDYYSKMVAPGENSAAQKKLGDNFLYVIGTFGSKSAISVPAEIIMSDEVDFSNEIVLGKLNSRIRHAKSIDAQGQRGYRYRFSTPTVTGFGIDKGFEEGNQNYYMCKCRHCNQWVLPNYLHDFIVPGWDRGMLEFSKDELGDDRYRTDDAYIKCPTCGKDLFSSLSDPERRQWVAKRPDVWNKSYQVFPWDVPTYNTPKGIVTQYADYPLKSDFFNFVIGLPFADADNTFETGNEHRQRVSTVELWIFNEYIVPAQTVGGMDVGKKCHLSIFAKIGNKLALVWAEVIHNTKETPAVPQVLARFDFFRMKKLCIDAGPDITLVNSLVNARSGIQAVVYVKSTSGLLPIEEKHAGDVINADRTKTLSLLLDDHNAGNILYPRNEELTRNIFKHLDTTKKVRAPDSNGVMVSRFIKTDKQDHWVHSMNYAKIANMACELLAQSDLVGVLPGVMSVKVGSSVDPTRERPETDHVLHGLFGIKGSRY